MGKHERLARIESVDSDGFFTMTLATEGEASDGDILSIEGGQIPDRMPLMLSHVNDPKEKMGSITEARKDLKSKPPKLVTKGQIEMGGSGVLAEIRRDIAYMTNKHGTAVSIRWDEMDGGKKPIRRVNLPSDHPHFVDSEVEKDWRKLNGYFWPEWKALEGSIVALGADPGANAHARAEETTGAVSHFWRAMAQDAEEQTGAAKAAAALSALRVDARACIAAGLKPADLFNAVADADECELADDFRSFRIGETTILLPTSIADQLEEERKAKQREQTAAAPAPEPTQAPTTEVIVDQRSPLQMSQEEINPPLDQQKLRMLIEEAFDASTKRQEQQFIELIRTAMGRVT